MAQWERAYCGLTHDTKVKDVEASLRLAVTSFATAEESEKERKAEAVRNLAKRLLNARLKALRARISALSEPGRHAANKVSDLRLRVEELEEQGITGVLNEFHSPTESGPRS
jgi:hypothetical protein